MPRKYKRLSMEDRKVIQDMGKSGSKVLDIAKVLGVHRDTIYKELGRCGTDLASYDADTARNSIRRNFKKM